MFAKHHRSLSRSSFTAHPYATLTNTERTLAQVKRLLKASKCLALGTGRVAGVRIAVIVSADALGALLLKGTLLLVIIFQTVQ